MIEEQLPPHNLSAEEAVIASILVEPQALSLVQAILSPADFFREKNAWVFGACLGLVADGVEVNQITVAHRLAQEQRLDAIGGAAYLSALTSELASAVGVESYAQIVRDKSILRHIIDRSDRLAREAYKGGDPALILTAADTLFQSLRDTSQGGFMEVETVVEQDWEAFGSWLDDPTTIRGIPTYYEPLDRILDGLRPGRICVIGAGTGVGKTTFGLNIARRLLAHSHVVAWFSLEMSAAEVKDRLLCIEAAIDPLVMREQRRAMSLDERERLQAALATIVAWPLLIDASSGLQIELAMARLRSLKYRRPELAVVFFDHIHLSDTSKQFANRTQQLGYIAKNLKYMAQQNQVAVIAAAQLNRAREARTDHRPAMHDLRDSGEIEQVADAVLFLHRPGLYDLKAPSELLEVIISKARFGGGGLLKMKMDIGTGRVTV